MFEPSGGCWAVSDFAESRGCWAIGNSVEPCGGCLISGDCRLFSKASHPVLGPSSLNRGRLGVAVLVFSFGSSTVSEWVSVHGTCVEVALCCV